MIFSSQWFAEAWFVLSIALAFIVITWCYCHTFYINRRKMRVSEFKVHLEMIQRRYGCSYAQRLMLECVRLSSYWDITLEEVGFEWGYDGLRKATENSVRLAEIHGLELAREFGYKPEDSPPRPLRTLVIGDNPTCSQFTNLSLGESGFKYDE